MDTILTCVWTHLGKQLKSILVRPLLDLFWEDISISPHLDCFNTYSHKTWQWTFYLFYFSGLNILHRLLGGCLVRSVFKVNFIVDLSGGILPVSNVHLENFVFSQMS